MRTETELDQLMEDCFKTIQGAQIYDEYRRFLSVLNRMPPVESMIEIGSEEGGTLNVWLAMWNPLSVFTVDMNSYGHARGKLEQIQAKWQSWLKPGHLLGTTWGDSHLPQTKDTLLRRMKAGGVDKVDLLYIDGDHSEAGVEQDYNMYKDLVKEGGLILFHDIHPYRGREVDQPGKLGVGVYKFIERLTGTMIPQQVSREYHRGARPPFIEVCHDCANQDSFGFLLLFV